MNLETVVYETDERVGVIRLNRPTRMNAVIEQMYLDLQTVLDEVAKDPDVRVAILTGTALRRDGKVKQAFCAGADLKEHAAGKRTARQQREYIMLAHETTRRLHDLGKPVIAAVNGPARGAGSELALNCDFLFMADEASLAFTETGLGTFVGGGVTRHLTLLTGMQTAKYLVYSGKVLSGREAVAAGLALRSIPIDSLLQESMSFARRLAKRAPISMAFAKNLIQAAPGRDLRTVLLAEAEAILACMNTEDWHEGIASFAEKREPVFEGK
ncbi:MAG TPA: enoyl-CoA hydratase/isomerase family protein [Myxococcota bacterium]|nr:enoyl-CoA hydratase/isomerase family protein [Myxococcota bacterium]